MDFYIGRTPVRRWKEEIATATQAPLVLSPLVTSRTAETVLQTYVEDPPNVYICFDPLLFTNGASSLATVRRLLTLGCNLFHLPDLHANIVLIPERFCSIGSRHLTTAGAASRHAVVVMTQPEKVREVYQLLQPWLEQAIPITLPIVNDLLNTIRPLRRSFSALEEEVRLLRVRFHEEMATALAAERERERKEAAATAEALEKARQNALEAERQVQRLASMRTAVAKYAKRTQARRVVRMTYISVNGYEYWTLLSDDRNLLHWPEHGQLLKKTYRYLCLATRTGRLAWARVMEKRITRFESSVRWGEPLSILGQHRSVAFSAVASVQGPANVRIKVDKGLALDAWFSVDRLEFIGSRSDDPISERLGALIEREWKEVGELLRKRMLQPFTYSKKLIGLDADKFMGTRSGSWLIRLGRTSDGMFLTLGD